MLNKGRQRRRRSAQRSTSSLYTIRPTPRRALRFLRCLWEKHAQTEGYPSSYSVRAQLFDDSEEVKLALGVHLHQALVAFGAIARQIQRRNVETGSDLCIVRKFVNEREPRHEEKQNSRSPARRRHRVGARRPCLCSSGPRSLTSLPGPRDCWEPGVDEKSAIAHSLPAKSTLTEILGVLAPLTIPPSSNPKALTPTSPITPVLLAFSTIASTIFSSSITSEGRG